jgi:hypothetical protein
LRRRDLLENAVVWEGGEEDVGCFRHLSWGVTPLQPLIDQVTSVLAALLLAVDRVSRGKEARRHVPAHVTEADETHPGACRGRRGHLPRFVVRLPVRELEVCGRLARRF